MSFSKGPFLVAIMGTTASGKTDLAETLALEYDAELINADAFQVYRGMDIGTAKPQDKSLYHLIDLKEPNEGYGLGEFCTRTQTLLEKFWSQDRNVIVVGGTGLYIRGLFEQYSGLRPQPPPTLRLELQGELLEKGLARMVERLLAIDPNSASDIDLNNPIRVTRALERLMDDQPAIRIVLPPFQRLKLAIAPPQAELLPRIENRVHRMLQNGWVKEIENLLDRRFKPSDPGFRAIGYSELAQYVLGQTELEEAIATTIAETRRYAKRQRTWLRSEPGIRNIHSTESAQIIEARAVIQSVCGRE